MKSWRELCAEPNRHKDLYGGEVYRFINEEDYYKLTQQPTTPTCQNCNWGNTTLNYGVTGHPLWLCQSCARDWIDRALGMCCTKEQEAKVRGYDKYAEATT